jgi:hypothetical protein
MPAAAARGRIDRIKRGAPDASLDMIDTPSEVAICSVGVTGRPSPGTTGSPGGVVGDEHAAQAAANTMDGTVSLRIRNMTDVLLAASAWRLLTSREYHG